MIVDRFGNPATAAERRALGFTERSLPDAEQETMNGVRPIAGADSGWDDRANGGQRGKTQVRSAQTDAEV